MANVYQDRELVRLRAKKAARLKAAKKGQDWGMTIFLFFIALIFIFLLWNSLDLFFRIMDIKLDTGPSKLDLELWKSMTRM